LAEIVAQLDGHSRRVHGPSDLSASMGHRGNPGHPEVVGLPLEKSIEIMLIVKLAGVLAVKSLSQGVCAKGPAVVGVGVDGQGLLANVGT